MNEPPPGPRDRLIDAAFTVVARDGLEAASVKAIAAEAAMTPGLLHYHFASKDALMAAALERALEAYRARLRKRRQATARADGLAGFFADGLADARTDAEVFRVRLAFLARALADPALGEVVARLNATATMESALTFAAAAGRTEPDLRDRELAQVLKAAFDGLMSAYLLDPAFPLEAAARVLEAGARAWLADSPTT